MHNVYNTYVYSIPSYNTHYLHVTNSKLIDLIYCWLLNAQMIVVTTQRDVLIEKERKAVWMENTSIICVIF